MARAEPGPVLLARVEAAPAKPVRTLALWRRLQGQPRRRRQVEHQVVAVPDDGGAC